MTGMSLLSVSDRNPAGLPRPVILDLAICSLVAVATVGLMLLAL